MPELVDQLATTEPCPPEVSSLEESPLEEPRPEECPLEEPPAEESPAEEPPAEESPAEEPPLEEPPAEESPLEEPPAEESPAEEPPLEEPPAEESPAKESPVEESPVEESPPPAEADGGHNPEPSCDPPPSALAASTVPNEPAYGFYTPNSRRPDWLPANFTYPLSDLFPPQCGGSSCGPGRPCPPDLTCCFGLCTDTSSDFNNCGTCGNSCAAPHATTACVNGVCQIIACAAGFANCDGNPVNGCETNILTDPNNCGTCGHSCAAPNATTTCVNGACQIIACAAGFANCDGNPATGCETNILTDSNNCGTCGHVCPTGTSCVNGACV